MYSTKCHFFSSVARHGDTVTDDTLTLLLSRIPNADERTLAPFVLFWEDFYNFCLHFKAVCNFLRTYFTAFDWKFARIPQVFLSIVIQSFSGTRAKDPLRSPLKFFLGLLQNLFLDFFDFQSFLFHSLRNICPFSLSIQTIVQYIIFIISLARLDQEGKQCISIPLQKAMEDLGFLPEEINDIFRIISAILKLGNLNFVPTTNMDGTEGCSIANDYGKHSNISLFFSIFFSDNDSKQRCMMLVIAWKPATISLVRFFLFEPSTLLLLPRKWRIRHLPQVSWISPQKQDPVFFSALSLL